MEDKRKYQIFVSSTYKDLIEERLEILNTILNMGHIPAGMENFPAIDEEVLKYIHRVIDQSDYFVLILAGKYGSVDNEGVSYTEREYDYAVKQKKPVIALIHENLDNLPREKTETNKRNIRKLKEFQKKVKNGRLVREWTNKDNLAKIFAISLPNTIKDIPSVGWMRGDDIASKETMQKFNDLTRKNQILENTIKQLQDEIIASKEAMQKINDLTWKNRILEKANKQLQDEIMASKDATLKNDDLAQKNQIIENTNKQLQDEIIAKKEAMLKIDDLTLKNQTLEKANKKLQDEIIASNEAKLKIYDLIQENQILENTNTKLQEQLVVIEKKYQESEDISQKLRDRNNALVQNEQNNSRKPLEEEKQKEVSQKKEELKQLRKELNIIINQHGHLKKNIEKAYRHPTEDSEKQDIFISELQYLNKQLQVYIDSEDMLKNWPDDQEFKNLIIKIKNIINDENN